MINLLPPEPPAAAPSSDPLSPAARAALARRLGDVRRCWARSPARRCVADRLRTTELAPDLEDGPSLAALEEAVHELAERRAELLEPVVEAAAVPEAPGRLLVCEFNMSIADGRSEAGSEGFFDLEDRPPWDTWLVCFGKVRPQQPDQPIECLISWVPEELVALACAGIDANRCGCIYWVGDRADGLRPDMLVP